MIENCSRLLFPGPADEEEALLSDATVAIADGRIVDVGPAGEMAGKYQGASVDGRGRLLTPGFVDSHTHLVFAGDRSDEFAQRCRGVDYRDIAAAGGGIRSTVRATRLPVGSSSHRNPPAGWEKAIAKLARERGGELVRLAEELEG